MDGLRRHQVHWRSRISNHFLEDLASFDFLVNKLNGKLVL